jgi:hypothetical protein
LSCSGRHLCCENRNILHQARYGKTPFATTAIPCRMEHRTENTNPLYTRDSLPYGMPLERILGGPNTRESMMRSSLFAVLAASILVLSPQVVSGQARFGVSGGLAAPMSDLGDAAELGYNVTAGLFFGGTRLPIGARIDGSLSGFSLKNFSEDVRILDATANAVVNIGQQPTSPYLIGGLGIYNSKFGGADSENALGVNLGGGLRFPVGDFTTFFEARYHRMLGDGDVGANLQFIPITFGIVF